MVYYGEKIKSLKHTYLGDELRAEESNTII